MDGVIIIYKEQGYTSFDVVKKLRGILRQKKIGHTGTLDPLAEGVLPVCIGRATKLVDILTEKDKKYEAVMRLGFCTDTEDITGSVITKEDEVRDVSFLEENLCEHDIIAAVKSFEGEYMQLPPMYSAIKKDGKKLYEYAREGVVIEREKRAVKIYSIENVNVALPDVSFDVHCSKGTYIRSLCRDIGDKLSVGGTLTSLKRSYVNQYSAEDALTLKQVEELMAGGCLDDYIIPIDEMLSMYKRLDVIEGFGSLIRNGNKLKKNMVSGFSGSDNEIFRVYDEGAFLALYQYKEMENVLKPFKMFL